MLRTLFEAAEAAGGERLATVATAVYALGALLVAWRAVSPLLSGVFEAAAARAGLTRGFTLSCKTCGVRTLAGGTCEKCRAPLGLSPVVRLWARVNAPPAVRRSVVSFAAGLLGSALFVVATAFVALGVRAFSPLGTLERLFIGIAAVAWAGTAFLLGRTFSLSRVGVLARARELAFGVTALGLAVSAVVVAQLARPVESQPVATLRAEADAVLVNGERLPIESSEVGLLYQLVESPALGTTLTEPLAFTGAGATIRLHHGDVEDWVLEALWQRAATLGGRGFAVKRRTETFQLTPGEKYEVRMGEREPTLTKQ